MEENIGQTPAPVIAESTPAPPVSKPPFKSWRRVGGLFLGTVILAGGIFFAGYQYSQKQQVPGVVYPNPTVIPTSFPALTPSPGTQYPTVTGKSPSTTPSETTAKMLSYQLPAGWRTVKNLNQDFEVGFNPQTMRTNPTTSSNQVWIEVQRSQPLQGYGTYAEVILMPYDGGSRHNFIYKQLGYTTQTALSERTSSYSEVSYTYNNRSCLILFGLTFSAQGTTWGMCAINSSQALFIQGPGPQLETEEFIKTIKWLK